MKKEILWYGGGAGLIIFTYSLILFGFFADFETMNPEDLALTEALGFLRYLILIVGIFLGVKAFRKNREVGKFKYWKAVGLGTQIAIVTAVFVGLMEFTYMQFINPDFFQQYSDLYVQQMRSDGSTEAEIADKLASMEWWSFLQKPANTGLFYFGETSILGFLMSLVIGVIFRDKK